MEYLGFISIKLSSNELAHSVSSLTRPVPRPCPTAASEGTVFLAIIRSFVGFFHERLALYGYTGRCTLNPTIARKESLIVLWECVGCVSMYLCVCKDINVLNVSFRETVGNVTWERPSSSGSDVFSLMNLLARSVIMDTPKPCRDTSVFQFYFPITTNCQSPRLFLNGKSILILCFLSISAFFSLHLLSMSRLPCFRCSALYNNSWDFNCQAAQP